jgi:hypothetical protein
METIIEYLYVIDSGFAYGGVIIRNDKVTETAPIFRKLMGRNTKTLKWLLGKWGWKLIRIVRLRVQASKHADIHVCM